MCLYMLLSFISGLCNTFLHYNISSKEFIQLFRGENAFEQDKTPPPNIAAFPKHT